MTDHAATPLLTTENIREWLSEHRDLKIAIAASLSRAREIEAKLDVLPRFLPADVVADLVGDWKPIDGEVRPEAPSQVPKQATRPPSLISVVKDLLENETGGRSAKWMREQIRNNPTHAHRLGYGSANLATALGRMRGRGEIVHIDNLYYLPSLHAKIASGDVRDDRIEEPVARGAMTIGMREIIAELGGEAVAGRIVERAKQRPELVAANADLAAGVYRWLSRESSKGHIFRTGNAYSLEPRPDTEAGPSPLFNDSRGGADVR